MLLRHEHQHAKASPSTPAQTVPRCRRGHDSWQQLTAAGPQHPRQQEQQDGVPPVPPLTTLPPVLLPPDLLLLVDRVVKGPDSGVAFA